MTEEHIAINSETFSDTVHSYKISFTEYLQQEHTSPRETITSELSCMDASVIIVMPDSDQPMENAMREFLGNQLKKRYRNQKLVDFAITNIERLHENSIIIYYEV